MIFWNQLEVDQAVPAAIVEFECYEGTIFGVFEMPVVEL